MNHCLAEDVGPRKIAQVRTVATLDESVAGPVPTASVMHRSELMAEGRAISARLSVDDHQLHSRQQLHCRRQLRSAVNFTCAGRVRLTGHQLCHTATDSARPPPQPSHPQGPLLMANGQGSGVRQSTQTTAPHRASTDFDVQVPANGHPTTKILITPRCDSDCAFFGPKILSAPFSRPRS